MVLRRQTFAGHTLVGDRLPRRRRRRRWLGVAAGARLLRRLRRRRARASPRLAGSARGAGSERVGGDRHRAGVRAGARLPVRQPLRRLSSSGLEALLFGTFLGITDGQVLTLLCGRRASRSSLLAVDRPAAAVRLGRRRRRRAPAACPAARCSASPSCCCSGSRSPRPARSPARCWSSRCSSRPAATAQQLTARPGRGPRALGRRSRCVVTWLGLAIAYFSPYPVGFLVTTSRFGLYVAVRCGSARAVAAPSARVPPRGGRPDARPRVHAQRLPRRHASSRSPAAWSATSSCCAARSSPATRSATSPSPARSPPPRPASTSALGLFAATRRGRRRAWAALGERARADDVVIGTVFAWVLGLGVLFLSIFTTGAERRRRHRRRPRPVRLDLRAQSPATPGSPRRSRSSPALALLRDRPAAAVRLARPRRRARRAGVPVRALGVAFLALLGVVAAEATQAVGALLLLGLLAAPGRRRPPAHRPAPAAAWRSRRRSPSARCGPGSRSATRSPRCRRAPRSSASPRAAFASRARRRAWLRRASTPSGTVGSAIVAMSDGDRDRRWAEHALAALQAAGYRRGGARTAVVEALARHDCAVTALELDDELRRRKPAGRPRQRLPRPRAARAARPGPADRGLPRHRRLRAGRARRPPPSSRDLPRLRPHGPVRGLARSSGRSASSPSEISFDVTEHDVVLRGRCERCALTRSDRHGAPGQARTWLSSPGRVGDAPRFFVAMKTYVATRRPPARLVRRRCRGPDPGPPGDADRRRAARQAQARVHAARRHRRLHRRRQRGEDPRHRQQARAEDLLAPQRLPGRDQVPDARRDARAPARGSHPQGRQGDAAAQPPRPPAADQAQGLRRPEHPHAAQQPKPMEIER